MPKQVEKIAEENQKKITIDEKFSIGDIELLPFSIPHDAADPCGYTLFADNKKISVATDIGHITSDIINHIDGSKFLLIESNYEPEILKYNRYPFALKNRIAGPTGHLPNQEAAETINRLVNSGLTNAILGHLSKESNIPEIAYQTVINELNSHGTNTNDFTLSVASRTTPSNLIHI